MTDVREATDDLLVEKPDVESGLRELLAVDERQDGWTFDEAPFDSGTFGELVSRDIVIKDDDGYEIADPPAVRASLDGEEPTGDDRAAEGFELPSLSLPSVSRQEAGALGAALAFVLLMRTYIYPSVFRGEYVVLPSNDPYYYRYWVEQLAANATGVFDLSVLSGLPGAVAKGEPLMVATLWWFTNLLGGADAAGWVLAWYPVVSALVVSVFVYTIAVRVTDDRRVGLASVAFLGIIPAFAYRTGLGFADHHAFDYPWLALTALSLVWLADVDRESLGEAGTWLATGALGVGVAGQVMAWEAGPLLIGVLAVFVAVRVATDVRTDRSSLVSNAPILVGLALATVLAHLAHTGFGWHTDIVTYAPALLLVGVAVVSLVGEGVRKTGMPAFVLGASEVAGALSSLVLLQILLPNYWEKLSSQTSSLLFHSRAAETNSIFAGGTTGFFLGPILEMGFAWVLGLPMLVLVSWRAYQRDRLRWLVVCTYGWYFLVLAALQRRFVGELAPFVAVLAGYTFVVLAAKLDVIHAPVFGESRTARATDGGRLGLPDRSTVTAVAVLFLFVSSAGAVQTAVRHEQVKIADDKFEAAVWMDNYAETQEWEYPQNYVLSKWGRNRMYNSFVNGESEGYGFARQRYEKFLSSKNPEAQYREFGDSVGFIVTKDLNLRRKAPKQLNYARLHKRFGSAGANGASGAGHYQAVYASEDGSVKVFTLVPGANLTGTAAANQTLTVSKSVEIEGASFEYRRIVDVGADGRYSVTVPYSGTYSVGSRTVRVPESAVENSGNVSVGA